MAATEANSEARLTTLRRALPKSLGRDAIEKVSVTMMESTVRAISEAAESQRDWECLIAFYLDTEGIGEHGYPLEPEEEAMDASDDQDEPGTGGDAGGSVESVRPAGPAAEPPAREPELRQPVDSVRAAGGDSDMDVGVPRPRPFPTTFGTENQKWPDEALYSPVYQSPLAQQTLAAFPTLTQSQLAHLPAGVQKQNIGEQIYGRIETVENNRNLSARLTGILLVLENADLMEALENRTTLIALVQAISNVLPGKESAELCPDGIRLLREGVAPERSAPAPSSPARGPDFNVDYGDVSDDDMNLAAHVSPSKSVVSARPADELGG